MDGYGLASLLPVAVVIALVLITRRTALSLLAGTVVGAVMLYGTGFAKPWLDVVYGVMGVSFGSGWCWYADFSAVWLHCLRHPEVSKDLPIWPKNYVGDQSAPYLLLGFWVLLSL